MRLFDVTGLKVKYIKPEINLTQWYAQQTKKPKALINASLYEGGIQFYQRPVGPPCGTVIEEGKEVHLDGYGYGIGLIQGILSFGGPWDKQWEYFLTGYNTCVQNGQYVAPGWNNGVFNTLTTRIALGRTKDGRVMIVVDEAVTLYQFAIKAIAQGIDILVNLDGGGSVHCVYDNQTIYSSPRVPYNALAFYEDDTNQEVGGSVRRLIDVSQHNGVINWEKVKKNVYGVMIRAGYGKNNIDPQFVRNVNECNRLGIPCGAYWFSYARTSDEAANEATYLLAAVHDHRMELPLAYDFEYDSIENAKKVGVIITKSMASEFVRSFCTTIEKAGYWALNYTNPDIIKRYLTTAVVARFGLWLAQWPSGAIDLAKPPRSCAIWQWGLGNIDGINTDVDMNEVYQDLASLIKKNNMNRLNETPIYIEPSKPDPQIPMTDKNWYDDAMAWVKQQGIMTEGRPNDNITRAEVAMMFYRMWGPDDDKRDSGLTSD